MVFFQEGLVLRLGGWFLPPHLVVGFPVDKRGFFGPCCNRETSRNSGVEIMMFEYLFFACLGRCSYFAQLN